MCKQKIAAPLVEPAAGIHHSDTYWVKNKSQSGDQRTNMREGNFEQGRARKPERRGRSEQLLNTSIKRPADVPAHM